MKKILLFLIAFTLALTIGLSSMACTKVSAKSDNPNLQTKTESSGEFSVSSNNQHFQANFASVFVQPLANNNLINSANTTLGRVDKTQKQKSLLNQNSILIRPDVKFEATNNNLTENSKYKWCKRRNAFVPLEPVQRE